MHFKARPWDFEKNHPHLILSEKKGLYSLHSFDPFIETIFLSRMKSFLRRTLPGEEGKFNVVLGSEITCEWLENKFKNRSLFGNNDSFLVLQAETISKKEAKFILEEDLGFEDKYFVLVFSVMNDFWENLTTHEQGVALSIEIPRFWENQKLLDYLMKVMKLNLSWDVRNHILETVPSTCSDYVTVLVMIKKNFLHENEITFDSVKSLLKTNRMDIFELASMFSRKKRLSFMKKVVEFEDHDLLRRLFSFMQGHLLKLSDGEYLLKKYGSGRVSGYNKELIACSKLWNKDEIAHAMRTFGHWEILAKGRNKMLINILRKEYLSLYNKI